MQESSFEIFRQRERLMEKAGWWKLDENQRNYILKKFRVSPYALKAQHFENFIMLVKHVKNNQFKFYKNT